ncbi:hypothetical protein ACQ4M4_09120 [Leptolyngbya sp. AN02str]|uniref:hypothetical protein n=1 Tax=Leptolyngbya sp. AN02str TaxID=3423363 RepID=UPI003D322922
MTNRRDIRALKRYHQLAQLVSLMIALAGLLAIAIFLAPNRVGMATHVPGTYQERLPWLLIGFGFCAFGAGCGYGLNRWQQRLLWIVEQITPSPMRLRLEVVSDSDGTSYYALLRYPHEAACTWKVSLYPPSWHVKGLALQMTELTAQVYFDPANQTPVAIQTQEGMLWRFGSRLSAQRIQNERST